MSWKPKPRESRRESRRLLIGAFRAWLQEHVGFGLPSWARHTTGASKAAVSKAMSEGRIRKAVWVFPDGTTLTLVNLADCARLDVYTLRAGWRSDLDDTDPRFRNGKARRKPAKGLGPIPEPPSGPDAS